MGDLYQNEWKEKIEKLERKFATLKTEVEEKEVQLQALKNEESKEDSKSFNANKGKPGLAFGGNRKIRGPSKVQDKSQFHMMHLLIAIIVGLGLGIITGKVLL